MGLKTVEPSLARLLSLRFREDLPRKGVLRTFRQLLTDLYEFIRDSTPYRRRQRYGDIGYDCDHLVETTAANDGWWRRLAGQIAGGAYQPCDPDLFHRNLAGLAIDYSRYTFIDLGSGKGRALLMASDYPFRRIIGIELLPELNQVALENISRYGSDSQRCSSIDSVCGDVRDFEFPDEPLVVFLFNPVPELALRKVFNNLKKSLQEKPRSVLVVYHNPVLEHVLAGSHVLRRLDGDIQYSIYASQVP